MKRLVDAHLAAKQRQAERLQRELEVSKAGPGEGGCRPSGRSCTRRVRTAGLVQPAGAGQQRPPYLT